MIKISTFTHGELRVPQLILLKFRYCEPHSEQSSLLSWRYFWRARSEVFLILAAEPPRASGNAARNISKSPPHSPRGFAASSGYTGKTLIYFACAYTIPPATQAMNNPNPASSLCEDVDYNLSILTFLYIFIAYFDSACVHFH